MEIFRSASRDGSNLNYFLTIISEIKEMTSGGNELILDEKDIRPSHPNDPDTEGYPDILTDPLRVQVGSGLGFFAENLELRSLFVPTLL